MKTKQKTILDRRKAHGESLREWLHDRRVAAGKRIAAETEARRARPRGVDRVPARYRIEPRPTEYVVEHTTPPRAMTRRPGRPSAARRLRQQRAMRLEYAVGESLVGKRFLTDEGEQAAIRSVRRWAR